jgi:hypothetical protein
VLSTRDTGRCDRLAVARPIGRPNDAVVDPCDSSCPIYVARGGVQFCEITFSGTSNENETGVNADWELDLPPLGRKPQRMVGGGCVDVPSSHQAETRASPLTRRVEQSGNSACSLADAARFAARRLPPGNARNDERQTACPRLGHRDVESIKTRDHPVSLLERRPALLRLRAEFVHTGGHYGLSCDTHRCASPRRRSQLNHNHRAVGDDCVPLECDCLNASGPPAACVVRSPDIAVARRSCPRVLLVSGTHSALATRAGQAERTPEAPVAPTSSAWMHKRLARCVLR